MRSAVVKVGAIMMSQNSQAHMRGADGAGGSHAGSSSFYQDEIRAGEFALSAGFDSVWTVEHHFSSHGESPSPLQQLTYFAGRVPSADLGTCVVVLPWNDPVRVAEQIGMLDNLMAPGSTLTIGFGRGSAQSEYDGFDIPLGESTERFKENWEIVKRLLTQENVSYRGRWRCIEGITTLPRPKSDDILSRCYYSWGSRSSMEYAAAAGFLPIFVPKGSADSYAADMAEFNRIRQDNGWSPVRPIISLCVFADQDEEYAMREGRRYLRNFYSHTLDHYSRLDAQHFRAAGNYQEQAEKAEKMAARDRNELLDELVNLQLLGTPESILAQLQMWRDVTNPSKFLFAMRFGGMTYEVSERNIATIGKQLIPELERWAR
jgi:alkanesulfonate monooxygenase SsuD/methylene tetrahydromethanopterin reductase-like flavin-dependent oxidoreductase (luciferase family)